MSEEAILKIFSKLSDDEYYKITSHPDSKYNCIAWAAIVSNKWYWPTPFLDGVYWPEEIPANDQLDSFIKLFESLGYETVGMDISYDPKYRKVALYQKPNGRCTHAARQLRNGYWTSKLGISQDIQHGTPYSIECPTYGTVAVILRMKM